MSNATRPASVAATCGVAIAKREPRPASSGPLIALLEARDLPQIHQEVGCMGLDLVCQGSRKAHMGLLGEQILLASHDGQSLFEFCGAAPEARPQLGVELLCALPPAFEKKC